jgi:hypothetical protein
METDSDRRCPSLPPSPIRGWARAEQRAALPPHAETFSGRTPRHGTGSRPSRTHRLVKWSRRAARRAGSVPGLHGSGWAPQWARCTARGLALRGWARPLGPTAPNCTLSRLVLHSHASSAAQAPPSQPPRPLQPRVGSGRRRPGDVFTPHAPRRRRRSPRQDWRPGLDGFRSGCACVRSCACARARVRARVCVCVCARGCVP